MMWAQRIGNELYVYRNGRLVYKRWYTESSTEKRQPSMLANPNGWPTVWIMWQSV
jgi:hypothetical protein